MDELIARLALAFRATARDLEWSNNPPAHDVLWKVAHYLENPDAAIAAIDAHDASNRKIGRMR